MSDIEQKAIALLNEVKAEQGYNNLPTSINRHFLIDEALCRAIERHEATKQEYSDFRQEVSDVVINSGTWNVGKLKRFIIPAPKPDPLEQVIAECDDGTWETIPEYAEKFRAALEARGLEIKEKGQ